MHRSKRTEVQVTLFQIVVTPERTLQGHRSTRKTSCRPVFAKRYIFIIDKVPEATSFHSIYLYKSLPRCDKMYYFTSLTILSLILFHNYQKFYFNFKKCKQPQIIDRSGHILKQTYKRVLAFMST